MRPTVRLFGALDSHASDEVGLRTQEDRERPSEHDPFAADKLRGCRLDDQVDLMQCAPNAEHWVLGASDHASDETSVATCHHVLAVRWHADQLGTPFAVQRVEKLDQHVKDIVGRVAIEHGNHDQVQIKKPTMEADANA